MMAVVNPAKPTEPDAHLLAAWEQWRALTTALEACPEDMSTAPGECSDQEKELLRQLDDNEDAICDMAATTPAGVAVLLKVALAHMLDGRDSQENLLAENWERLQAEDHDRIEVRLVLAALQSLGSTAQESA